MLTLTSLFGIVRPQGRVIGVNMVLRASLASWVLVSIGSSPDMCITLRMCHSKAGDK